MFAQVAPLEPSLQPAKQQIQRLDVRMEQAYTALPKLTVRFASGGVPVAFQMEIPIELAKFATGYAAGNAQQFAAVWAQVWLIASKAAFNASMIILVQCRAALQRRRKQ